MHRRSFLTGLLGVVAASLATPVAAPAQAPPKVGLLSIGTDPVKPNPVWVQFLKQLEELGYVEGQNIAIDYCCSPTG